ATGGHQAIARFQYLTRPRTRPPAQTAHGSKIDPMERRESKRRRSEGVLGEAVPEIPFRVHPSVRTTCSVEQEDPRPSRHLPFARRGFRRTAFKAIPILRQNGFSLAHPRSPQLL